MLEIGALNMPVFTGEDVKFADYYSADDLRTRYPAKDNIRDIDYTIPIADFSSLITERFRLVIANHVLQLVPDVLGWLAEVAKITEPGGWLVLAIPDKRYTFDLIRPVSSLSSILDCGARKLAAPTVGQIFDHLYLHRKVSAAAIWDGQEVEISPPRVSLQKALSTAVAQSASYNPVHCHVFTAESFEQIFHELEDAGLVSWTLKSLEAPLPGSNEFLVALRKSV